MNGMDPGMEKIMMEAQSELIAGVMTTCRAKTIKNHSSPSLSQSEQTEFQNCVMKFMEAPQIIMSAVQNTNPNQFWRLIGDLDTTYVEGVLTQLFIQSR